MIDIIADVLLHNENVGYEEMTMELGTDMRAGAGQLGCDQRHCEYMMARVEVLMMGGRIIITPQPTFSECN